MGGRSWVGEDKRKNARWVEMEMSASEEGKEKREGDGRDNNGDKE